MLHGCGTGLARLAALAVAAGLGLAPAAAQAVTLDELYAAAKPEGLVTVYGAPSPELRQALSESFGKRFPDIKMEYTGLTGGALSSKVLSEHRAGVNAVDVIVSGTTTGTRSLKPFGVLAILDQMIVVPDARDPSKWGEGGLAWADKDKHVLAMTGIVTTAVAVNKDLVKPGELTKDADFLNPKWKGKIVTNSPQVPGNANKQFRRFYDLHGPDFIRKLVVDQQIMVIKDLRQAVDWIAKGQYAINVGANSNVITLYIQKGIDTIRVEENMKWDDALYISPGFGGLMVPKSVPHPHATKLFVNWILTKDGQAAVIRGLQYPTYRTDVDQSEVPNYLKMIPGRKYMESFSEEYLAGPNEEKLMELLKELNVGR